jgi:hypothetical protein
MANWPEAQCPEQYGCGFGWWFGGLRLDRGLEFFMRTID